MARPALPVEEKERRGTLEKSRLPKNMMKPSKVMVEEKITIPSYLNKYGRNFYRFYFQRLADLNILTETDLEALGMMAAEYGRYLEAQYTLKKEGSVIIGTNKGGSEYHMVSPWINIANQAYKNFYNMMSRFGISPADRQKLSSFQPKEDDRGQSLESFLKLT